MALVKVKNLSRVFDVSKPWLNRVIERRSKAFLTAVSEVDFEVEPRSTYALVGESGSGKSTIGKMLVGLLKPTNGVVEIEGIDLASETDAAKIDAIRSDIQMIFQDPYASLNPRMSVYDTLAEPLLLHGIESRKTVEQAVLKLMDDVGLARAFIRKYPHEFSGGQRQRIAMGRALATNPDFVVADEPVSALDVTIQAQILDLMLELGQQYGLTMLFVSHDLAVVRHIADRIIVLYHGKVVEQGSSDALFNNPQQTYTKTLLQSIPGQSLLAS